MGQKERVRMRNSMRFQDHHKVFIHQVPNAILDLLCVLISYALDCAVFALHVI